MRADEQQMPSRADRASRRKEAASRSGTGRGSLATVPERASLAGVRPTLRIGFVPLIDAAPFIAAQELGLFARHGVRVVLEKQIGWANVRDKLAYGHLDAAHALIGMPLAAALSPEAIAEPLISVMEVGSGGNAITVSKALADRGVRSAATLAKWIADRRQALSLHDARSHAVPQAPLFAHVLGCSMHHYLLREWLSAAGIRPDLDVRLAVIPPSQMAEHMKHGHLDGFCVGEPWNTLAERDGAGVVVTPTIDVIPDHPEKVLAMTRRRAAEDPAAVVALVKALIEACIWCADETNHEQLAQMLSQPAYIGLSAEVIVSSLRLDRTLGAVGNRPVASRPAGWRMRSFAADRTFPMATHAAWLAEQMIRWGHASSEADVLAAARACTDASFHRQAAMELQLPVIEDEFAPMPLRHGAMYDPRRSPYRGPQHNMPVLVHDITPEFLPALGGR